MDAGELRGGRVARGGEQRVFFSALGEFELRALPHALVAVAELRLERGIARGGEARGEEPVRLATDGIFRVVARVHAPDRAEALQRIAAHPIDHHQRAVGVPAHADAHDAVVEDARIDHLERRAVALDAEAAHLSRGKFVEQKNPALAFAERGAGIVFEARGAVGVVRDRRQEKRGLAGEKRFPHSLAHPQARLFHILVIATPAAVARFGEIDETLAFALHVGVVVHGEEIAVVVEGRLLGIADAVRVNLEARAVGLDAHDATLVGIEKIPPFLRGDVQTLVADAPVDAAVGSDAEAVHIVAGVGEVNAETVNDDLANVRHAVVVGVLEPPEVGRDRRVNPAVVIKDAGGDAGDVGVKSFRKHRDLVRDAVAVGVAQLVDALGVDREILPVDGAVLVVIRESAARRAEFSRRERVAVKRRFPLDACERDIVGNPHRVLANIEVGDLAARGGGHINAPLRIDRACDGIGDVQRARPFLEDELARGIGGGLRGEQRAANEGERDADEETQRRDGGSGHGEQEGEPKKLFKPIRHSERSEESTWTFASLHGHSSPAGFFAPLRMTETRNPKNAPTSVRES